jgi:hypothetical protein
MHMGRCSAWAAAAILSAGCTTGSSVPASNPLPTGASVTPTAPSPTPTAPAPAPAPSVTSLTVAGLMVLTDFGQTTQLKATATLADGTTQDVTTSARWSISNSAFGMTAPGQFQVLAFGVTPFFATYMSRSANGFLTATPPGTFAVYGGVREPGAGTIPGVRVTEITSGRSTLSSGQFTLGALPSSQVRLVAEKDTYESPVVLATATSPNVSIDIPMQRFVQLTAGETVTPHVLAPHDLSYLVGTLRCDDCRLMHVIVPVPGRLHIHITWTPRVRLTLFAEGRVLADGDNELTADVPVSTPGEVLIYLGVTPPNSVTSHTTFKVETSMQ